MRFTLERFYQHKVWGDNKGMVPREVRGGYRVGFCKEIKKEWETFLLMLCYGRRESFWKDKWCWEVTLRVSFPSLFALAVNKETSS